jgi:hypothetical protein
MMKKKRITVPLNGGRRNLRFAVENGAKAKRKLEMNDRVTGAWGGKGMLRAGPEGEKCF